MIIHIHIHCWHSSTGGAYQLELFDHPPYSPNLTPSNYHLPIYLKNWVRSQYFNHNEELMEGVKMWLSSQAADFFDTGIQKVITQYHKCSILAVTMLRSSLNMYIFFCV
jgi:hypothetical protein